MSDKLQAERDEQGVRTITFSTGKIREWSGQEEILKLTDDGYRITFAWVSGGPVDAADYDGELWASYKQCDLPGPAASIADYLMTPRPQTVASALSSSQPVMEEAKDYPTMTLNGYQLRDALEFIAPDGDADQMEMEVTIANLPADKSPLDDDNQRMAAGMYAWITDYPEEGCIPLLEEPPQAPAPSQPSAASGRRTHIDAVKIVHAEAGRTLSRDDYDMCVRIAKAALTGAAPADANVGGLSDSSEFMGLLNEFEAEPSIENSAKLTEFVGRHSLRSTTPTAPEPSAPADKVDAERYRWLRTSRPIHNGDPFIARNFGASFSMWTDNPADEAIDAAIDRMRSEDGKGAKL